MKLGVRDKGRRENSMQEPGANRIRQPGGLADYN